jgi:hypothetical protein
MKKFKDFMNETYKVNDYKEFLDKKIKSKNVSPEEKADIINSPKYHGHITPKHIDHIVRNHPNHEHLIVSAIENHGGKIDDDDLETLRNHKNDNISDAALYEKENRYNNKISEWSDSQSGPNSKEAYRFEMQHQHEHYYGR